MSLKQLKQYLENISKNKPVNLTKFLQLIRGLNLDCDFTPQDIQARKVRGHLYNITQIKPEILEAIQNLATTNMSDRVGASTQNRSHSVRVAGSLLNIRRGDEHPETLMFDVDGELQRDYEYQGETLLVLENKHLFLQVQQTLNFLRDNTRFNASGDLDIIFAEGNAINNRLHQNFLSRYKTIYLVTDMDLGGLKIADNLMRLVPTSNVIFLVPDDIEERLNQVEERMPAAYIDKVITLGVKNIALASYAEMIRRTGRTLEQEAYFSER